MSAMPLQPMSGEDPEELRARLALLRVAGIGPRCYRRLLDHCGSARTALTTRGGELDLPSQVRERLRHPDWAGADRDLEWSERPGHRLLQAHTPDYPSLLAESLDAPPVLFVRGEVGHLAMPQLALVGSRNPTPGGRSNARDFAAEFARRGFVVTSGMAFGIDAESHRGALDAGGATVAVMGTGPDRIYPGRHLSLAREIAERGALVSEFPVGTPALPANFPRRNRIIAALALGTLGVEAAESSGSLLTARASSDLGREVFAIPGSIHSPVAKGCHALIRQGAKLVEGAQHVIEELEGVVGALSASLAAVVPSTEQMLPAHDSEHEALLYAMGFDPVSVDSLASRTQLTPAELSSMLLILELEGRVAAVSGGRYVRIGLESPR